MVILPSDIHIEMPLIVNDPAVYIFHTTHNIRCFLLDATIRSAPIITTDRIRNTANTAAMMSVCIAQKSHMST